MELFIPKEPFTVMLFTKEYLKGNFSEILGIGEIYYVIEVYIAESPNFEGKLMFFNIDGISETRTEENLIALNIFDSRNFIDVSKKELLEINKMING